ncbi:MAG: signal peptidase II [Vicinamibacteraceae bacterium]
MLATIGLPGALLLAMAGAIGCDRLTKHVATVTLAGTPGRSFLGGAIQLEYAENPGAFLGLGSAWPPATRLVVFATATFLGLWLIASLSRRLRVWPASVGLGLIAGGSLSNLADRVVGGSVVDFLYVGVGPVHTGIFNVADVAIVAGAILVVAFGRIKAVRAPASPIPHPEGR